MKVKNYTPSNAGSSPVPEWQRNVLNYVAGVAAVKSQLVDYHDKMEKIDKAYAHYVEVKNSSGQIPGTGKDISKTPVGVVNMPPMVTPLVVSQVDSMVAYLGDVFLSGSPIFPVVSSPADKLEAEQLEALIDDHATLGGYPRELLNLFRDAVKYNIGAMEAPWGSISNYSVSTDYFAGDSKSDVAIKAETIATSLTKLKTLDMYNVVWDTTVKAGDVSKCGDFAGYVERLTGTRLVNLIAELKGRAGPSPSKPAVYNETAILEKHGLASSKEYPIVSSMYKQPPEISIHAKVGRNSLSEYVGGTNAYTTTLDSCFNLYEVLTLYCRITPGDFKIPGKHSPGQQQIWKFIVVDCKFVLFAEQVISAYDYLPILFAQPLEDGLRYQTRSIAEASIPYQELSSGLANMYLQAARRSVYDRALYDPNLISPADINSPIASPKIPVRNLGPGKTIDAAYKPIPFSFQGMESLIPQSNLVIQQAKEMQGLNNPQRGQFQKGNKSVQEWQDTMAGSDARLRLPALALEYQFFTPLKEILKLNIFQFGTKATVVSQKSGKSYEVDIEKLKEKVLRFQLADGYTPKSKLAGTDSLMQLMLMISQSPILMQAYGPATPQMFSHLASLLGVKGLQEYTPNPQAAAQNMVAGTALQSGIDPRTGQPILPEEQEPTQ